jgi:hypothetical protein
MSIVNAPRVPAKFRPNRFGLRQLISEDNYLYNKSKVKPTQTWWYCIQKVHSQCPATATTYKIDEGEFVKYRGEHTHGSNLVKIRAQELDLKTVQAAVEDMSAPPTKILASSFRNFASADSNANVQILRRSTPSMIRLGLCKNFN